MGELYGVRHLGLPRPAPWTGWRDFTKTIAGLSPYCLSLIGPLLPSFPPRSRLWLYSKQPTPILFFGYNMCLRHRHAGAFVLKPSKPHPYATFCQPVFRRTAVHNIPSSKSSIWDIVK